MSGNSDGRARRGRLRNSDRRIISCGGTRPSAFGRCWLNWRPGLRRSPGALRSDSVRAVAGQVGGGDGDPRGSSPRLSSRGRRGVWHAGWHTPGLAVTAARVVANPPRGDCRKGGPTGCHPGSEHLYPPGGMDGQEAESDVTFRWSLERHEFIDGMGVSPQPQLPRISCLAWVMLATLVYTAAFLDWGPTSHAVPQVIGLGLAGAGVALLLGWVVRWLGPYAIARRRWRLNPLLHEPQEADQAWWNSVP